MEKLSTPLSLNDRAEIPRAFFEAAEAIATSVQTNNVRSFLLKHLDVISESLTVLCLDDMAPYYANNMILMRNWRAVAFNRACLGFGAQFAFPSSAVDAILACTSVCRNDDTLWCEVKSETEFHVLRRKGVRFVEEVRYELAGNAWTATTCASGLTEIGIQMLVSLLSCVLSLHSWNPNAASSAFGLSPIDIMIVEALRDPTKVASLSATQLSTLKKV